MSVLKATPEKAKMIVERLSNHKKESSPPVESNLTFKPQISKKSEKILAKKRAQDRLDQLDTSKPALE